MRATIDVTVSCTIEDPFLLSELARQEVEAIKPREDWELFYPKSPTEALQQLVRSGIATKLLAMDAVTLHEIGHKLRDTDMPLGQLTGVLGFSEQSVLSRACRRWFDASPSQVRRDLRTTD